MLNLDTSPVPALRLYVTLLAVAGLLKSVSVAAAVYTTVLAAMFSAMAVAVTSEVNSGPTSSTLFTARLTVCSVVLLAASVATTVKV